MAHLKLVSAVLAAAAVLVLAVDAYSVPNPGSIDPCQIQRRCSTARDLAWGTDGNTCLVFQNECFLINENCARLSKNQKPLTKSPTSCQSLCRDSACTLEFNPQCAIWGNRKETFSNPCVLKTQVCIRADPPEAVVPGKCS